MKVKETFTIDRPVNASTGYNTVVVKLEKLALADVQITPPVVKLYGSPGTKHFMFQAIEPGKALVQFASYSPWDLSAIVYEDVLSFDVEAAEGAEKEEGAAYGAPLGAGMQYGGWLPFAKLSPEDTVVFDEAFKGFVGAAYKPFLVTSQPVSGRNYIFVTNGHGVYPNAREYPALVFIFKPLSGKARVIKIKALGHPGGGGSLSPFRPADDSEKALAKKALAGVIGASYEGDFVSPQVVSGFSFHFAGTQTLADKGATKTPVIFTIYQPPTGNPVFTGAQKVYDLL